MKLYTIQLQKCTNPTTKYVHLVTIEAENVSKAISMATTLCNKAFGFPEDDKKWTLDIPIYCEEIDKADIQQQEKIMD